MVSHVNDTRKILLIIFSLFFNMIQLIHINILREKKRDDSLFGNSEGVVNESLHNTIINNNNFVFPIFEISDLSISATTKKTAKPELKKK